MSSRRHTPYHLHIGRAIFASLAIVAVSVLYIPSITPVQKTPAARPPEAAILAYATNVSAGDLASGTNTARAQNGLGGLGLVSSLSLSAQLKANDMINNNYWAHVSPTGVQPWYWFGQAGYDYTNAGENLAYGFSSSDAVVTAWMNSPGHRANILGNYTEMGFGIANGENYQGGQNTVVVAHYGTPRTVAAAPTPVAPAAPTAPVATPSTPSAPATTPTVPEPTATTPAAPAELKPVAQDTPKEAPVTPAPVATTAHANVTTPLQSTAIPVWKQLLAGTAPAVVLISATILAVVSIGYVATHISLVKHATVLGERYVLHHPFVDASVAVGAALIMLVTTVGHIS